MDAEAEVSTFTIRINDGPAQTMTVRSGIYEYAVAAVPALFDAELPCTVEIYIPHLVEAGYGPYLYGIKNNEYGHLQLVHLVDLDTLPPAAAAWWRDAQAKGSPLISPWPPQEQA